MHPLVLFTRNLSRCTVVQSLKTDNHLSWFSLDHKCFLPYSKQIIHWLPYQSMLYWVNQTNKPEINRQNVGLLLQENLYSQFLNCVTLLVVVANDARLQCFSVIPICQYTKIYFSVSEHTRVSLTVRQRASVYIHMHTCYCPYYWFLLNYTSHVYNFL